MRQAKTNESFTTPDVMETGPGSRAELIADDHTVTRVGSNTIFSFHPTGRGIKLDQGSVLFNSPTGKGGGKIETKSATASVLGTTIIVSATRNGGFKMLVLEGKGKVTLPNGRQFELKPGQLTFIVPGMTQVPPIIEFRLSKLLKNSNLLQGFDGSLPSTEKLSQAEQEQERKIAEGKSSDTGLVLGDLIDNQVQLIDPNARQNLNNEALVASRFLSLLLSDAFIDSPYLDPNRILQFTVGPQLFDVLNTVGEEVNNPTDLTLFPGYNMYFFTPFIDLSPYNNTQTFVFFALGDMLISGDLDVFGFDGRVIFESVGNFFAPPGAFLNFYSFGGTEILSDQPMGFLGNSIISLGPILFKSNGPIVMDSVNVIGFGSPLGGGLGFSSNAIEISADGGFFALNSTFDAFGPPNSNIHIHSIQGPIDLTGCNFNFDDRVDIRAIVGTINIVNGVFTGFGPNPSVDIFSGGNMNVGANAAPVFFNNGGAGSVRLVSNFGSTMNINYVTFNSAFVHMEADTLNIGIAGGGTAPVELAQTNGNAIIILKSSSGNASYLATTSTLGAVNLGYNVTYQGSAVTGPHPNIIIGPR
jgi:hypothetical protein